MSARIIDLMRLSAAEIDDQELSASIAYVRTETFFVTGDLESAHRALVRAVDDVRAPSGPAVSLHAARGALHMRAAVVAARAGKTDEAGDHIFEAGRVADVVPEGVYCGTAFGPASVKIHDVAIALELGDSPTAVRRGADWKPPRALPAERRSHYYIDLAPAQLDVGRLDDSFVSLQSARMIAPQHVRENPRVRRTLAALMRAQRTKNDDLAAFATWAGVR